MYAPCTVVVYIQDRLDNQCMVCHVVVIVLASVIAVHVYLEVNDCEQRSWQSHEHVRGLGRKINICKIPHEVKKVQSCGSSHNHNINFMFSFNLEFEREYTFRGIICSDWKLVGRFSIAYSIAVSYIACDL